MHQSYPQSPGQKHGQGQRPQQEPSNQSRPVQGATKNLPPMSPSVKKINPEPQIKRDNSHLKNQTDPRPIKKIKTAQSEAPNLPNIPRAAADSEQSFSSPDSLPDPLSEKINSIFKDIGLNLKAKPIKTELLKENILSLEKLTKDPDLTGFHPLFFQKMAGIYLALGNINKASDCSAKTQRRIQKFYYETMRQTGNTEVDFDEEERNFSRQKMEIDIDEQFPRIEKAIRKENKSKKSKPANTYSLGKKLNAFVLTPTHKHQYLSSIYPECENAFSDIEIIRQKKQKILQTPQKEVSDENDDDEYLKAIKLKEKEIQLIRNNALGNYELEEKKCEEVYENIIQDKLMKNEIQRQVAVEKTFFNSKRTNNPKVKAFAETIVAARYGANRNIQSEKSTVNFEMSQEGARTLITAEKTVMEQSTKSQHRIRIDDSEFAASLTPTNNPQNKVSATQECIKYGNRAADEVKYDMPKDILSHNHQGNYCLAYLGSYSEIAKNIKELIGSDNRTKSKELAEIMLNLIRNGEPITEGKLKPIVINQKELFKTVGFLTKLCVNFYKETFRRSSPAEKKHQLPYAVGQARGLILAKEGKINLLDLFDPICSPDLLPEGYDKEKLYGAPYGIATTPAEKGNAIANNVEKVEYKLKFINSKYNEYLLEKMEPQKRFPGFFEENRVITKSTREQIHQDLLDVYGGESDTDGEGYSSDESYAELPDEDMRLK